MRGSAGRIMIRPGQAIMIAWLTTAHAPLWEPAHERAPTKKPTIPRLLDLERVHHAQQGDIPVRADGISVEFAGHGEHGLVLIRDVEEQPASRTARRRRRSAG